MELLVIVKELDLIKENQKKKFGDIFEVDEDRAKEILNYRFNDIPVVITAPKNTEELENKVKELEETNSFLIEENKKLKADSDSEKPKDTEESKENVESEKENKKSKGKGDK